jgi:hypothetical protein
MKTRIQVLSQGGRLIGVYVPPLNPPTDPRAPRAAMVAGPKQKLYEVAVEIDVARLKDDAKHSADFHASLRKRLKLKK